MDTKAFICELPRFGLCAAFDLEPPNQKLMTFLKGVRRIFKEHMDLLLHIELNEC